MKAMVQRMVVGVVALAASACATVSIPVQVTRPAEINMARYKQIAVGEMQGEAGHLLAERINEALMSSGRFEVLDRQNMSAILREQRMAAQGLVDQASAAELGRLKGSAAIVFGHAERSHLRGPVKAQKSTCYRNGKSVACTTYSRSDVVKVKGTVKVTDVSTGRILKTKSYPCEFTPSSTATNQQPDPIDPDPYYERCFSMITGDFMKSIAPYTEIVRAHFVKDGNLPMIEQGILSARYGNWDDAIAHFNSAVDASGLLKPEVQAKAWWNLGLAYEYSYKFDEAIAALKKASSLHPHNKYVIEIANVNRLRAEQKKLEEQDALAGVNDT